MSAGRTYGSRCTWRAALAWVAVRLHARLAGATWSMTGWKQLTIVTAIGRVVERVAVLAVVATGRGGGLAHLMLALGLEVGRVHPEAAGRGLRGAGTGIGGSVQMAVRVAQ